MILLTGAERTGKSTLAKAYAEARGITFMPARTTQIWAEMGLTPGPLDPDTRMRFQDRVLEAHIEDCKNVDGPAISDRCPLDFITYLMIDLQGTDFDFKRVEAYLNHCVDTINRFGTAVVLLQPGLPYVEDEGKLRKCLVRQELFNCVVGSLMLTTDLMPPVFRMGRDTLDLKERIDTLNLISARVIEGAVQERATASLH